MKVVILAGGLGSRLAEETEVRPKPMVEIGGKPILWHILKHYDSFGFREFVIALGYKGSEIKKYFLEYGVMSSYVTVDTGTGNVRSHNKGHEENWTVHLVDTGRDSMTGGRLRRLEPIVGGQRFMLTYGDGVSDVDVAALLRQHEAHGKPATVTAVRPPSRFGEMIVEGDSVVAFTEKPQTGESWINGGFMVFEPEVFRYLDSDKSVLEVDALERMASDKKLGVYKHPGFWQCMDTLRDKRYLESVWAAGNAPWRTWSGDE